VIARAHCGATGGSWAAAATPLSLAASPRTGGFASPSCDGFAFHEIERECSSFGDWRKDVNVELRRMQQK
jgi:hypothetical protein